MVTKQHVILETTTPFTCSSICRACTQPPLFYLLTLLRDSTSDSKGISIKISAETNLV